MATIRKRGKTWRAEVRIKGQEPQSKSFTSKGDAKLWADETESAMRRGKRLSGSRHTLHWLIGEYKKGRELVRYQKAVLQWWDDRLGETKISDLHRDDFTTARRALQALPRKKGAGTLAPATVNRRMAAISAVLSYGMVEHSKVVETNPAQVKGLTEDNKRDPLKATTQEERDRLLAASRAHADPTLYAFVRTAMATGARAGELQKLRWGDVDLEGGLVRFHDTKNGDNRVAPLAGEALEILKARSKVRRIEHDLVFYNRHSGGVYNYRPHWMEAKAAAGVSNFRFHDWRHVAASELANAGVSLMQIGAMLGHRSAQMTLRYSHYSTEAIQGLGKKLTERIG